MLISPTSLATTSKFQKNICFKTRAVGLINIKAKECKSVAIYESGLCACARSPTSFIKKMRARKCFKYFELSKL